jgi:two-component system sensor histidine kinase MprB
VSFRRRLALSCGAAVAVAVVLGCGFAYWIVRDTLRDQIDNSLLSQVRNLSRRPPMAADEVMAEPIAKAASSMLSANTSLTTRDTENPLSVARW